MAINYNSILVFEYYTASGINNPSIISEAIALIDSLLYDLSSFFDDNIKINFLVSKNFKDIGSSYGFLENNPNKNKIIIDTSLEKWLEDNISNFDSCMFISAEENMNLYNLTKIIEDKGVKLYGSSSEATLMCSNKYSTFTQLKSIVNQPKTYKFTISEESQWEIAIKNLLMFFDNENNSEGNREDNREDSSEDNSSDNSFKLIVKPLYGVDCQDMLIISDEKDIAKISKIYPENSEILVQEFIYGENLSVSLISDGKTAIPLTLNKQYLEINKENPQYLGGELPLNHPLKDEIFSIAKKVVELIEGIKGFVGVDLIVKNFDNRDNRDNFNNSHDDIYFLEINSRFTTPYVGISKISKFNIGKTIIDLIDNKISIDSIYDNIMADFYICNDDNNNDDNNKYVKFRKNGNDLDIEIL